MPICRNCENYHHEDKEICKHCSIIKAGGYSIDYQIQYIENEIKRRKQYRVGNPNLRKIGDYVACLEAVLKTLEDVKKKSLESREGCAHG